MKRAGLLHCVGLAVPRYNLLRQRGQLPFLTLIEDQEAKWANFTLHEAFRLRVMLDLMAEEEHSSNPLGLGPKFAASVAGNATMISVSEALSAPEDIWIGVAGLIGVTKNEANESSQAHFCGPVSELGGWLARQTIPWRDAYQSFAATRIFLANATNAARFVLERARELELPEAMH